MMHAPIHTSDLHSTDIVTTIASLAEKVPLFGIIIQCMYNGEPSVGCE